MKSGFGARRRRPLLILTPLAVVGGLIVLPAQADVSYSKCAASGLGATHQARHNAYTCLGVEQSSNLVQETQVGWMGRGQICDYTFQLRWYNAQGVEYASETSHLHFGCRDGTATWVRGYGPYFGAGNWGGVQRRAGKVCAYLFASGRLRRGVPCQAIYT